MAVAALIAASCSLSVPQSSALAQAQPGQAQPPAKAQPGEAPRAAKPAAKRGAKQAPKAAAQPNADPNGEAFPQGIAAATAGRHDEAVRLLTAAIQGGKLKQRDLARALYLRGASYKATKKIALAIADLTNALYMRNGLAGDDRKQAIALRAASYAEGGLSDQGQQDPVGTAEQRAPTTSEPAPRRATASAAPSPTAAPPKPQTAAIGSAWTTSARPAPAAATEAVATHGAAPNASVRRSREAAGVPSETATTTPATWASATTVAAPAAGADTRPARTTRTASLTPAPAAGASPQAAPKAVPRGLMIQAAAVRRQDEAESIAKKARASLGGAREAYVDTTVMGNMGTFYRVLVGPYAKEADSRDACASLRKGGLDCLMVKR